LKKNQRIKPCRGGVFKVVRSWGQVGCRCVSGGGVLQGCAVAGLLGCSGFGIACWCAVLLAVRVAAASAQFAADSAVFRSSLVWLCFCL